MTNTDTGGTSGREPDTAMRPEFSRLIPIDGIGPEAKTHEIAATAEECAALARRFDLEALHGLTAEVTLRWMRDGELVRLEGRFAAEPEQPCVVSVEPVATRLSEKFTMYFTTEADELALVVEVSAEEEDPPEPITGDAIDIGEAVVQQFGVALEPYPRLPEAVIEGIDDADTGDADTARPFAGLSSLLKGKGG